MDLSHGRVLEGKYDGMGFAMQALCDCPLQ
jgi:hypothetical protein